MAWNQHETTLLSSSNDNHREVFYPWLLVTHPQQIGLFTTGKYQSAFLKIRFFLAIRFTTYRTSGSAESSVLNGRAARPMETNKMMTIQPMQTTSTGLARCRLIHGSSWFQVRKPQLFGHTRVMVVGVYRWISKKRWFGTTDLTAEHRSHTFWQKKGCRSNLESSSPPWHSSSRVQHLARPGGFLAGVLVDHVLRQCSTKKSCYSTAILV